MAQLYGITHASLASRRAGSSNNETLQQEGKCGCRFWCLQMQLGLHLCAQFLQPHYPEVSCPDLLWKATVMLSVHVFMLKADASGSWREAQLPSTSTLIISVIG